MHDIHKTPLAYIVASTRKCIYRFERCCSTCRLLLEAEKTSETFTSLREVAARRQPFLHSRRSYEHGLHAPKQKLMYAI